MMTKWYFTGRRLLMGSINKQLIEDIRGKILPAQIVYDDDDEEEDWDANRVKNRQWQVQRSKERKA